MTSILKGLGLATLAAAVAVAVMFRPDKAFRVALGVVAHDICSKTFISGFDADAVWRETATRGGIRWLSPMISWRLDRSAGEVSASLFGVLSQRAVHGAGFGCVLVDGERPIRPALDLAMLRAEAAHAGPPLPVDEPNPALAVALARGFEDNIEPPLHGTKAIVVVRDGRVIGERYAPGVGPDTPLLGFSLTKSVVNALVGRMVQDGRMRVDEPAPIPEWRGSGDPRAAITVEQLMRMSTGLDADETNSGFDVSSRILYLEREKGAAAAALRPVASPGARWHYSSPSTILIVRALADRLGGAPDAVLAFAWRELFVPLGMTTPVIATDGAGQPIGSTYMFAGARDWARLGLLFLNDGVVGDRRLLPRGWADFSARATLGGYYGAGFWTLRSEHPWSRSWARLGMPDDAFYGSGDLGQRLLVIPSRRMVIVRLGDSVTRNGDMPGFGRLVREVLAATP